MVKALRPTTTAEAAMVLRHGLTVGIRPEEVDGITALEIRLAGETDHDILDQIAKYIGPETTVMRSTPHPEDDAR